MWLRIPSSSSDLILGLCYFPPESASKWKSGLSPFDLLRADIIELQDLGQLLLAGDFNARTCTAADCLTSDETPLPPRHNTDLGSNSFGQQLISICKESGLIILNGRVPGDTTGACTYDSKAQTDARSLVDYFLCSPDLAFKNGSLCHGIRLSVLRDIAFRAESDHWPLSLTLPPFPSRTHRPARRCRRRPKHNAAKRWAWNPPAQDAYSDSISSSPLMQPPNPSDTPEQLLQLLKHSVNYAATHACLPQRPLTGGKRRKPSTYDISQARWYGPECTAAYHRLKRTNLDEHSGWEARQALRHYKLSIRRAKRRHIRARQAYLADLFLHKPHRFWKLTRPSGSAPCQIPKALLHAHFSNLRTPPSVTNPPPQAEDPAPLPGTTLNPNAMPFFPRDDTLNAPFSVEETQAAMSALRKGKAADSDGIITELLTAPSIDGAPSLAPFLTSLINKCFLSGTFPTSESIGHIVPIFKGKGDPNAPNLYRGITIISVFSKLYAAALNTRLAAWRLSNPDHRARGQGGFLRNHRTTDHLFILQHIIDKYRVKSSRPPGAKTSQPLPLLACFIDLSKAFDTINRAKLWKRLSYLGVRGNMLSALQAYYSNVRERVLTPTGFTNTFPSDVGVKQGCPLSPTLFGIFVDALENYILQRPPPFGWTCSILERPVPLLLYADDIVFFATSQSELQHLLNLLATFTSENDLTVNLDKTAIISFTRSRTMPLIHATFNSITVKQSLEYKYLGIIFNWRWGVKNGAHDRTLTARKAMFSLEKQIFLHNIFSARLAINLFNSLVSSTLLYGAEIWGVYNNHMAAQQLQTGFLKRILHLPKSTDNWSLFTECDCTPIDLQILQRQHSYWNRLATALREDRHRLLSQAFTENLQIYNTNKSSWTKHVALNLTNFAPSLPLSLFHAGSPIPDIKQSIELANVVALRNSISLAPCDNRDIYLHNSFSHAKLDRRRTYARWFWNGPLNLPLHISDPFLRTALTRFRLGAHDLRIVSGCRHHGLDRRARLCECCAMGIIEDEFHLTFECPLYLDLRRVFADLFTSFMLGNTIVFSETDGMMRKFYNHDNQYRVAKFVIACLQTRYRL